MRFITPGSACAFALLAGIAVHSGSAHAANWQNPYSNVDHRWDNGNDTGDSQIDRLNAQQLDQNYRGPWTERAPAQPGFGTMPPPAYGAPPPSQPQ